jgi:protein-tyrosine phosphatase
MNWVRELVSGKRNRYKEDGINLDLTYITNRIVAMGYPAAGIEAAYRNSAVDVSRFLNARHPGTYMLLNLSERPYDESTFDHRVMNCGFPDHHAPPWDLAWTVVLSLDRWLRADHGNVVVVHCKAGKGRTGTIIAAALVLRQWVSFGPESRVLGPEFAEGFDLMHGAFPEDPKSYRGVVTAGASGSEFWTHGGSEFPSPPPWAQKALRTLSGGDADEIKSPSYVWQPLVLRPPPLMTRAALRLFWARRGEGVTQVCQARTVLYSAIESWKAIARALYEVRKDSASSSGEGSASSSGEGSASSSGEGSASSSGEGSASSSGEGLASSSGEGSASSSGEGLISPEPATTDSGPSVLATEDAKPSTKEVFDSFEAWLESARRAVAHGDRWDGFLVALQPRRRTDRAYRVSEALERQFVDWPIFRVVSPTVAEEVTMRAIRQLRSHIPSEPPARAITRVSLPVPPTLPSSLGSPVTGLTRLYLVIEATPHENTPRVVLFNSLWLGPHSTPTLLTGTSDAGRAAAAVADPGRVPEGGVTFDVSGRTTTPGHVGLAVAGDITLRIFSVPDAAAGLGVSGPVEVCRTTFHTGLMKDADLRGRDTDSGPTTVRHDLRLIDTDSRKERLRGLVSPGAGSWLPSDFALCIHMVPTDPESAAAERRIATARSSSLTEASFEQASATVTAEDTVRGWDEDSRAHALTREGWVWKQGELNRGWKQRWLALRHREVFYYRDPATPPAGSIPLSECTLLDTVAPEAAGGRRFCFMIRTPTRTWLLQAASELDQAEWISVIAQAWASLRVPIASRKDESS